ncbi:MAG TPA: hypothetical protein VL614_15140 [Acetobacteraceae bacterium]|nr:hypothetical protein [Acetobacteraceae bacterium]
MDIIAEARQMQVTGQYINGGIFHAMADEITRLRAWITAIGELPDVDADNRDWMARCALDGDPAP